MTALALFGTRVRTVRIALSLDAVALLGLGVLFVALTVVTWGTWGNLGQDTGYDLVAGARVAHGELPYADFTYYYGPLAPFLLGGAAWLGGVGILPAVLLGLSIVGAIVGLTYLLARTFAPPLGAALAAAIVAGVAFAPTNFSFVLPHTESAPLGMLCLLLFLLHVGRAAAAGRTSSYAFAGIAGGLAALTRPEVEVAFVVAAAIWLALELIGHRLTRTDLLAFLLPALAIPAAVYGAFLFTVTPHQLLFENLYPVDTLRAAGDHLLAAHAPLTAASFGTIVWHLAVYAAAAAALVVIAPLIEQRRLVRYPAIAAVGAAIVVAAAHPETTRFYLGYAYGWIPAGALIFLVVLVRRATSRSEHSESSAAIAQTAVLAVLALPVYAAFTLQSHVPQPAVYVAPFVALFLARLHLSELASSRTTRVGAAVWLAFLAAAGIGLAVRDARPEVSVSGPGGTLAASAVDAPTYRQALRIVEANTRPGEAVLFAPQLTALYALSGRVDPLRQISLLPGALPRRSDELAAMSRLRAANVRVIVTDRHPFTEYGHSSFGTSFDRALVVWIQERFRHIATISGGLDTRTLDIWRRT
jgi:hypothetical protein